MSFDKPYNNRKDKRKPYYDSRSMDSSCRNHGTCSWYERNRQYKKIKTEREIEEDFRAGIEEYYQQSKEEYYAEEDVSD